MASEDARSTETSDSASPAELLDAGSDGPSSEADPLATFVERLQPARRFYANPADK